MTLGVISIILTTLGLGFFVMIKDAIAKSKKQGELEKELEGVKDANKLQKDYIKIASRPQTKPNAILKRMRSERDDK